ncbi:hypothetical protein B0H14DRAFT_3433217 [Mycena olivaceomarginata]|nr:hypothetical protein B0H14DRAFT_3433217 [Mycena olivaceomarginata]
MLTQSPCMSAAATRMVSAESVSISSFAAVLFSVPFLPSLLPLSMSRGDYLFAPPVAETVFAYPGTPAASSFNSTPNATAPASPFAMPMSAPTMSPDAMLHAYATKKKHTSSSTKHTSGAEVVPSSRTPACVSCTSSPRTRPRGSASGSENGEVLGGAAPLIRAGPRARLSR